MMRSPVQQLSDYLDRRYDARWGFTITAGQMPVSYIMVTSSGRNHAAIEIGTGKKYPRLMTYGGTELHIAPSKYTHREQLDRTLPASTSIMWPDRWRGWNVIPESQGGYSIRLVLLRPDRRHYPCTIEVISEDERVARILAEDSTRGVRARLAALKSGEFTANGLREWLSNRKENIS
jgi:hypothetical protein